jgi:hypothetical protein
MTRKRAALWAALVLAVPAFAGSGTPAKADPERGFDHGAQSRATRYAIYVLENRIARLEADPYVDDGYKAPIISGARAEIFRLRATLPAAQWRWTVPCCYSRKPVHIR